VGVRVSRVAALLSCAALLAAACSAQSPVGSGVVNGVSWAVVAFPGDDGDVCFQVVGVAATCDSLRDDEIVSRATTSIGKNDLKIAVGAVRPDVTTVRVLAGDQTVDVEAVPLSFRSDLRAYAAAFESDESPRVVGLNDSEGNALPVPTF